MQKADESEGVQTAAADCSLDIHSPDPHDTCRIDHHAPVRTQYADAAQGVGYIVDPADDHQPSFGAMINASIEQRASFGKTSTRAASCGAASMILRASRGVSGSTRPSDLPYKR